MPLPAAAVRPDVRRDRDHAVRRPAADWDHHHPAAGELRRPVLLLLDRLGMALRPDRLRRLHLPAARLLRLRRGCRRRLIVHVAYHDDSAADNNDNHDHGHADDHHGSSELLLRRRHIGVVPLPGGGDEVLHDGVFRWHWRLWRRRELLLAHPFRTLRRACRLQRRLPVRDFDDAGTDHDARPNDYHDHDHYNDCGARLRGTRL